MLRAEIRRIIISDHNQSQIIHIKEVEGDRSFPMVIGMFEAISINRLVKGLTASRPLTHDLLAGMIGRLGGKLQDVVIGDLRDQTYFARLRIRREGRLIEIDSRPSDAISIALILGAPIFLA